MRALLLVGLVALGACRGGDSEEPPVHLIHNMDTQEKGRPYRKDTSGLFPNGRMMQMPIEGTVAVGQLDDDDFFNEGIDPAPELLDGGRSAKPDVAFKLPPQMLIGDGGIAEETLERGHLRYDIYCSPCHGLTGDGKGLIAQAAFDGGPRLEVPPADLTSQRIKDLPIGKIYAAIKHGVNNGNMPPYATQVPVSDRWAIASYVRKQFNGMDPASGKPPEPPPDPGKVSVALGGYLYRNAGCNACHSLDGTKIVGPSWKGLYGKTEATSAGDVKVDEAYIKESILEPKAKIVNGFGPVMPPPVKPYTDIELDSIILFIKAQQ